MVIASNAPAITRPSRPARGASIPAAKSGGTESFDSGSLGSGAGEGRFEDIASTRLRILQIRARSANSTAPSLAR